LENSPAGTWFTQEPPVEPGVRDLKATTRPRFHKCSTTSSYEVDSGPEFGGAGVREGSGVSGGHLNFAKTGDPNG
jgi:hypothetical protein